eukprot:TRINITY_DN1211_c0_g1_i2.p5 TRINITY_DN1211_c0_g1~~TRINITY_DN1211_c0_g1_i2.p5  ORF type:complete len:106 (-),score=14.95 TRINITY_DN1211_c0_g1_i2:535-852(-)
MGGTAWAQHGLISSVPKGGGREASFLFSQTSSPALSINALNAVPPLRHVASPSTIFSHSRMNFPSLYFWLFSNACSCQADTAIPPTPGSLIKQQPHDSGGSGRPR